MPASRYLWAPVWGCKLAKYDRVDLNRAKKALYGRRGEPCKTNTTKEATYMPAGTKEPAQHDLLSNRVDN